MRRMPVFILGTAISAFVPAQCPFPITADFQVTCANLFGAHVTVGVNGGLAPYQIVVERFDPTTATYVQAAQTTSSVASNLISLFYTDWIDRNQARVRVTDASNCVVQNVYFFQSIGGRQFTVQQEVDCTTGQVYGDVGIKWSGGANTPPWTFSWDFGTPQNFSGNWTSTGVIDDSGYRHWRSNAPLNPGEHYLMFPQYNTTGFQYCQDGASWFFQAVTQGDCGVNIRVKAALDGALPSGTLMDDNLRANNLVPLTQPYTTLGYTLVGSPTNVSVTPAMLAVTGNDAIVDWVLVELRSSTTTVAYSKPALLQRDGDIVDADGDPYLNFPIGAGNYRLALRHRNHLGVMTSTTIPFTVDLMDNLMDFRSPVMSTHGTNARVLKNGIYCLWGGDATANGTLAYTGSGNDRDAILQVVGGTTPNNVVSNVYDRRDTNMDGVIKYAGANNDRDIILLNVGSTTPNSTRTQQLP